jgi:hypothetical protein
MALGDWRAAVAWRAVDGCVTCQKSTWCAGQAGGGQRVEVRLLECGWCGLEPSLPWAVAVLHAGGSACLHLPHLMRLVPMRAVAGALALQLAGLEKIRCEKVGGQEVPPIASHTRASLLGVCSPLPLTTPVVSGRGERITKRERCNPGPGKRCEFPLEFTVDCELQRERGCCS